MQPKLNKTEVGVLIVRFQTHQLHKGHVELLDYIAKNHKKVIVFLGISPVKVTRNNPLDYFTRKKMIESSYPGFVILPIKDLNSNERWSKYLDSKIKEVCDMETVTLYGSKDSFIPTYQGTYPTVELDYSYPISATESRKQVSEEVRETEDFRAGVIYAAFNKYPTVYQTVDIVIERPITGDLGSIQRTDILLGRKKNDKDYKWRFIGGFLDPTKDRSLEDAAKREAYEETGGLELTNPSYITSLLVDDWRYRKEVDKIVTAIFRCKYVFGVPKPSDDIDELRWFDLKELMQSYKSILVDTHIPLFEKAYQITLK